MRSLERLPRWEDHDSLRRASEVAALGFALLSAAFLVAGPPEAALLCLAAGAAGNGILTVLWDGLPRMLRRMATPRGTAWATFVAWQFGVLFTSLAFAVPAFPVLGGFGSFLLLTATFLAIDHFGTAFARSSARHQPRVRARAVALALSGVFLATSMLFLALSFREGARPDLRALALMLGGFGALAPGAWVVWELQGPRRFGRPVA